MNVFRLFGIGSDRILANNCHVPGRVTKVDRCWWYSVRTRPVRLYPSARNTVYPNIITFSYTVDNIPYEGKLFVGVRYRCPQKGESIAVYYDPEKPQNYACYAFGPGMTSISW